MSTFKLLGSKDLNSVNSYHFKEKPTILRNNLTIFKMFFKNLGYTCVRKVPAYLTFLCLGSKKRNKSSDDTLGNKFTIFFLKCFYYYFLE